MSPELSRRVASIMNYVHIKLGLKGTVQFVNRVYNKQTFDKLNKDDKTIILNGESFNKVAKKEVKK